MGYLYSPVTLAILGNHDLTHIITDQYICTGRISTSNIYFPVHAYASFVLCKRLVSIFKLFTPALCLISSSFWFIRFYMAMEVEPYENGGGRAMEEREMYSGWERGSRKKNIPIFGIRDRYKML